MADKSFLEKPIPRARTKKGRIAIVTRIIEVNLIAAELRMPASFISIDLESCDTIDLSNDDELKRF